MLFGGAPTFAGPLTHMQSGIKTGADLKGKKFVGETTANPRGTVQSLAFLANWGLTKEDVIWIKVPGLTDAVNTLIEGTTDAVGNSGPGLASVNELDAKKGALFLSLNTSPEAIKAYNDVYQFEVSIVDVDPDPKFTRVRERTTMLRYDDYYIAREDQISDEEAYDVVKAIFEHHEEVRQLHVTLSVVTKPEFLIIPRSLVPYHPGAIEFYKEKGLWTQELEDRNNELLALEAEELK